MDYNNDRREFMKKSLGLGLTLAAGGSIFSGCTQSKKYPFASVITKPLDTVRIGFVGVGGMGTNHVKSLLKIEGAQLCAVCDIVEEKVARIQKMAVEAGQSRPIGYSKGPWDFKRMCETEDLDLVYNATPWEWHVPICVEAMRNGKHAATEVPAALTVDDCWKLVENSEKLQKHCVMMENCCYDRYELMILNMVRKGLFGELIHGQGGYMHDLRSIKFNFNKGEGIWRTKHSIERNGNLYPTHGLGPIAQCMNINRGDQFDYLVSMSSKSVALNAFAAEKFGSEDPLAKQKYALGDVNYSIIHTKKGLTILLGHDCNTPRPYSRQILIQGTKGIVRVYPEPKIHIEGKSPKHKWEPIENYQDEYEHPLWTALSEKGKGVGHGGMDYIENYRLINALRTGTQPDMDVYDAAAWSVVSELSEKSVAKKSSPIDFPDFTRGRWKTRPPLMLKKI